MTPAERTAHVAALVRGVDPVRLCWAPSSDARLPFCGGSVTWTGEPPRSSCSRCNATGFAAAGEASEIRRLFGRSAAECQGAPDDLALDTPAEL